MTVFTERIELDDGVSDVARRAQGTVTSLADSLGSVMKGLGGVGILGGDASGSLARAAKGADDYAASLGKVSDAITNLPAPQLGDVAGPKRDSRGKFLPRNTTPIVTPPSAPSAPVASAPAVTPTPMPDLKTAGLLVGVAAVNAYDDALQKAASSKQVIANLPDPKGDGFRTLQTLAGSLTEELKSAEAEMVKANALGDAEGFVKASGKVGELQGQLSKLPAPALAAKEATKSVGISFADAAHASEVGASTIGAAMTGIKQAFVSLASGDISGAISSVTDSIAGMAKMLDLVVPGLGQLVAVVVQIAGGIVGAFAAVTEGAMKMAVEASQAKQQMLSMFDAMGDGKIAGEELDEMLSGLADDIGISKDKLAGITKEFVKMGVTGRDELEKLTKAAISATAIVGEGGAAAFESLIAKIQVAAQTSGSIKIDSKLLKNLKEAGLRVDDLAAGFPELGGNIKDATVDAKKLGEVMSDSLIKRGEGPLKQLASTWDSIKGRLTQAFGDMFEDLSDDVGPFMEEVKSLFDIFQNSKESGKAMKSGIVVFLHEMFGLATKLVPLVKHFLLDMVIYSLKAYIALKPVVKAVREFFASATGSALLSGALDGLAMAFKVIGVVVLAVIAVVTLVAGAFMAVVVAVWSAVAAVVSFGSGVSDAITNVIAGTINTLRSWVAGAPQMAIDFITGLVAGITGGGGLVTSAVSNLASGAIDAFTGLLGIKSPSTVMAGYGRNMGEGLVVGTQDVAPDVHGAASDMASMAVDGAQTGMQTTPSGPPSAAIIAATSGGSSSGSTGASVVIEAGAIVINGADKSVGEITEEMFAALMERIAMQMGVA